nr:MAG TPA: hypothetical protein [Caudoviricetes sp.]
MLSTPYDYTRINIYKGIHVLSPYRLVLQYVKERCVLLNTLQRYGV